MSSQIVIPTLFEGNPISAEVILDICLKLTNVNRDIEEIILEIIPNHEDFDSSYILNEISTLLFNEKSFDSLIFVKKHKQSLKSSIAFLLTGNSNKQDIVESSKLISGWNLDDDNIFRALCISFHVLMEIFLSDKSYFSYEDSTFNRDLETFSQLELDEIFKVKNSFFEQRGNWNICCWFGLHKQL